jgi:hypothetical protein
MQLISDRPRRAFAWLAAAPAREHAADRRTQAHGAAQPELQENPALPCRRSWSQGAMGRRGRFMGSMIEDELRRIQQRPQHILGCRPPGAPRAGTAAMAAGPLPTRSASAQGGRYSSSTISAGAGSSLPPAAKPDRFLLAQLLLQPPEFIRCNACTTLVCTSRSHGQSLLGFGPPERIHELRPHLVAPRLHRPRSRRTPVELIRHAGDVVDRIQQHFGRQPTPVGREKFRVSARLIRSASS